MDDRGRKEPKDILVGQVERISRAEWDAMPGAMRAELDRRTREAIAHFIQEAKVPTAIGEYQVERRLELSVATPNEFWGVVEREADRIAMRYGRSMPLRDGG